MIRVVVVEAQAQARRLGHRRVGTEHLLLALLVAGGRTAELLREQGLDVARIEADIEALRAASDADRHAVGHLGIDLDRVRDVTESVFGPGALERARDADDLRRHRRRGIGRAGVSGHIPFSRPAKTSLEMSLREALRLRHRHIGPEHVALGILREGSGLACAVLARRGLELERLRAHLETSATGAA